MTLDGGVAVRRKNHHRVYLRHAWSESCLAQCTLSYSYAYLHHVYLRSISGVTLSAIIKTCEANVVLLISLKYFTPVPSCLIQITMTNIYFKGVIRTVLIFHMRKFHQSKPRLRFVIITFKAIFSVSSNAISVINLAAMVQNWTFKLCFACVRWRRSDVTVCYSLHGSIFVGQRAQLLTHIVKEKSVINYLEGCLLKLF